MSFYPRSGRRGGAGQRGGYMSSSSSGWSQPIYNMNPLDVISNFVSPILDIVSPLEDIKELMNQGLRWYQRTPMQRLVQKQKRKKTPTGVVVQRGQRLPQKYRIVIDCTGFNPNALRTNIKCVQDNRHLIVSSDMKKGRQFKRSYTLPKEVETKKMTKFVTPTCQLVIEFCYVDTAIPLGIKLQPRICQMPEGKCVHVNVPIADFVDPNKVQLHVKGRDLIVRFEERIVPCGDSCSRVLYHNRVSLPQNVNVNVNAIKAKCDKHKLTILAPVTETVTKKVGGISQQLHEIPIQHKMRHRKTKAVSGVVGQATKVQQPTITEKQKKQKKTPLETMPIKAEIGGGAQKKPAITEKKQKKPSLLEKPAIPEKKPQEQLKPSILEKKPQEKKPSTLEEKKPTAETLPGVTAEEKKKKKKKSKKLTATSTAMPTTTPTETSTTSTLGKEPSPAISEERLKKEQSPLRSTESGADILKKVFETGGKSSEPSSQGQQSTSTTTQSEQRIGATSNVQL